MQDSYPNKLTGAVCSIGHSLPVVQKEIPKSLAFVTTRHEAVQVQNPLLPKLVLAEKGRIPGSETVIKGDAILAQKKNQKKTGSLFLQPADYLPGNRGMPSTQRWGGGAADACATRPNPHLSPGPLPFIARSYICQTVPRSKT